MKKLLKSICYVGLISLSMTMISCKNNSSKLSENSSTFLNISSSEVVNVAGLTLTSPYKTIKVGEQMQLDVTVLPSNATNKRVIFTTSNNCVSVSETAVVTGQEVGDVKITAKTEDGNFEKEITLTVVSGGAHSALSIEDYADALSNTPYTLEGLSGKEKYGLSQSDNVGVNESLIIEKYAIKADTEFESENIINVSNISLEQIQEFFKEAIEVNGYYQIQTAIYLAKEINDSGKEAKIKFINDIIDVDGSLSSSKCAFDVNGLNGTYFEGNDTVINLKINEFDYKGYFNVRNSKNIFFNGITMQLDVPSSLTGTIIEGNTEDKKLKIKIFPEFNKLIEKINSSSSKPSIRSWVEFHYQNKTPLQGGNFVVDAFESYLIEGDVSNGYTMEVTFKNGISRPRNGSFISVQFTQYDAYGFTFTNCENSYFENMTMHNAYGMGLTASSVTNFYVNRFNLCIPENSNSLMTATADAMHFSLMHGQVQVTNSLIEYSHDDALNLKHGNWYKLSDKEGGSTKTMEITRLTGTVDVPKPGDKIAVYNETTFESYNPTKGYYTIDTVENIANGYRVKVKERMSNVGEWGSARVTFLSNTPDFVFSNNIVRNKRNRGVLVQVPNAVIENNSFINVGHGSIQAASAMDIYNEATLPQGAIIKNNKFINNCYIKPEPLYGDISIFAISNNGSVAPAKTLHSMTIENNFITNNGNAAVSLRGVGENTNIKDNLFYECSSSQPSGEDLYNCLFNMYNCEDITLDGNYNHYTLGNNLSGIITEGKTSEDGITILENNTSIKFKENTEAGPEVNVSKAIGSINIDGNIDEWESIGATNIEIIAVSDAEGTERTTKELEDHFRVNKLMITYNDNGIYIGFDIFDDEINVKTVNDFWLGDCVEIFMSCITNLPNADMQVYKEEGGVLQAAFAPKWVDQGYVAVSNARTNSKYVANKSQIQANVKTTSGGYAGEVFIPFTFAPEFKESIDSGNAIDIAIVVADAERDSLGLKRVQAANVPHFVESYKTKTARMPQYIFK